MAGIKLEKDKIIYKYGQPMTALHMITAGSVNVTYPGGSYHIGKGDVIGICEVCSEVHFLEYLTAEDTVILTYPMPSMSSLHDLLEKHNDVAGLFIVSAFRQINDLLSQCDLIELSCNTMYQELLDDYQTYSSLCSRYRITPKELPQLSALSAYLGEEAADVWLSGYYTGLLQIFKNGGYKTFVKNPSVSIGLIRKTSLDFRKTYLTLEDQHQYQANINRFYFSEDSNDLFAFMTSLYYKLEKDTEDSASLYADIHRIIKQAKAGGTTNQKLTESRTESFLKNASLLSAGSLSDSEADSANMKIELVDSLSTILDYAGNDLEAASSFRRHLLSFKTLSDKSSMEENICALRQQLANDFYTLYAVIFEKTISDTDFPIPVRMFLYFGYVDEELAGIQNSQYLYTLAENMGCHGEAGVYTFYDWLLAIFHGEKQPSRNEFDIDYTDYINKQKLGGAITDAELKALKNNPMSKVIFELRNMFPMVNKMTYGRVNTFCPLFLEENVLKELSSSLLTVSRLGQALDQLRQVDYTAFYRESLDTEHMDVMGRQYIHTEYRPDFILMPNVGLRGVMWQEIEGRKRTSPARMMFSIFHLEDLNTNLIRLIGEYRWEICKRIQGSRWNDISDRSLTSEYFDYVQFYRRNHDLSAEAKERVRLSLQRTKNSFKEMFVRDYLLWVLFEATGSPRLNKVARNILFTYCPLPVNILDNLKQNPQYTDLLSKRDFQLTQKLHLLDVLETKIKNAKKPVPDVLQNERNYLKGEISKLT